MSSMMKTLSRLLSLSSDSLDIMCVDMNTMKYILRFNKRLLHSIRQEGSYATQSQRLFNISYLYSIWMGWHQDFCGLSLA